ncbi:MAG: hypothetical protein GXP49_00855 [Deltaproteobacteria bacterium]|nr:hypothetical protein [Deltaproteobacteria bacterium]
MASLEDLYNNLVRESRHLKTRLQDLATKIGRLKSGYITRSAKQDLANFLAESQEVSIRLEAVSKRLKAARKALNETRREMVMALDSKMSKLEKILLQKGQGAPDKEQMLAELIRLQKTRNRLLKSMKVQTPPGHVYLEVDPLDGPKELRRKASFLKERAGKLKKFAWELEERKKIVARSIRLEGKLRDVAEGEALFDESRSCLGGPQSGIGQRGRENAIGSGNNMSKNTNEGPSAHTGDMASDGGLSGYGQEKPAESRSTGVKLEDMYAKDSIGSSKVMWNDVEWLENKRQEALKEARELELKAKAIIEQAEALEKTD